MIVGQSVEFTCECCGEKQEQILEQTIIWCYGRVICWSCGETIWYEVERNNLYPKLTPEQELFWERWQKSLSEWREKHKDAQNYLSGEAFKEFHNNRVSKLKQNEA